MTSVVLAVLGILPMICFFITAATERSSGSSIGFYIFMLLGIIVHGIGLGLGITGLVMRARVSGIIGILGNSIILFFVLIGGLMASTR